MIAKYTDVVVLSCTCEVICYWQCHQHCWRITPKLMRFFGGGLRTPPVASIKTDWVVLMGPCGCWNWFEPLSVSFKLHCSFFSVLCGRYLLLISCRMTTIHIVSEMWVQDSHERLYIAKQQQSNRILWTKNAKFFRHFIFLSPIFPMHCIRSRSVSWTLVQEKEKKHLIRMSSTLVEAKAKL